MGKHEALAPKAIANRIKAKGLQKLRWYCQMCQKQCRDENGFKCHTMSESHQRQLLLFADSPHTYIDTFSREFFESFLELLKHRFGTKRVHANQVYQEYIADRHHLHMNATKWVTLTAFVKWLGRDGHCTVDETEKGWFITWIDRDPETIRRQEALAKKEKMALDDDEKLAQFIERQVEAGQSSKDLPEVGQFTELQRELESEEKIAFNLIKTVKKSEKSTEFVSQQSKPDKVNFVDLSKDSKRKNGLKETTEEPKKKKSALDEIMQEQEQNKEKVNRKDFWLAKGIVVKIVTKRLGEKYYKMKGVVEEVVNKYEGIIQVLESGDRLKVDQVHLETVIPAAGRQVHIVNGAYRGCTAILESLQVEDFSATLCINSMIYNRSICQRPSRAGNTSSHLHTEVKPRGFALVPGWGAGFADAVGTIVRIPLKTVCPGAGPTRGRIISKIKYEDICKSHAVS